ncbi:MAG: RCC1 domain-containing protein [Acidimicrobiales bacterium]
MSNVRGWGRRFATALCVALIATLVPVAGHASAVAGSTFTWGANASGQLGRPGGGGTTVAQVAPPLDDIVAIDGGGDHTVALTADGRIYAWGANTFGQVGNGTFGLGVFSGTPVLVTLPGGVSATSVVAGANHSLATGADGRVYAWGSNTTAQLSLDPSTVALRSTPVAVQGVTGATAVAAGDGFSMALANGTVYAWGDNQRGQLGTAQPGADNTLATIGVQPRPVAGLGATSAIGAGGSHALAISNGQVMAWGDNAANQLNDSATSGLFRLDPRATGVTGATAVAGGAQHSVALLSDGTVRTWG